MVQELSGVQEVASEAADYGIEYGLEVVNRYETNILNTAQQVSSASSDYEQLAAAHFRAIYTVQLPSHSIRA